MFAELYTTEFSDQHEAIDSLLDDLEHRVGTVRFTSMSASERLEAMRRKRTFRQTNESTDTPDDGRTWTERIAMDAEQTRARAKQALGDQSAGPHSFHASADEAPSRATPRAPTADELQWASTIALAVTYASVYFQPRPPEWGRLEIAI